MSKRPPELAVEGPDWEAAGINLLPEQITTGVWKLTRDNVGQFKH